MRSHQNPPAESVAPAPSLLATWLPMFGTWLIMAIEAPFVAAVVARMPEPKLNLAAFGVAYAVALLVEAPVITMLSASTALVRGPVSYRRLWRFGLALNVALTLGTLLLVLTPAWSYLATRWIGLPPRVVELSRVAILLMTFWPAAIGYRRFFQGLLIQSGRTRRVAGGTVTRLVTMAATCVALLLLSRSGSVIVPGAWVGTGAIAAGVLVEALACRLLVRDEIRALRAPRPEAGAPDYRGIAEFYWPLALTTLVAMAVHPMVTFFMGRARFPLESLAVLPVVNSLVFLFRSVGLSYQEVAIAHLGRGVHPRARVLRFAGRLAAGATVAMALLAFTPLSRLWFQDLSGLSPELARFALTPTRILCAIPALSVLLAMQRAVLVDGRRTRPITRATFVEVATICALLAVLVGPLDLVGATAAAIALVVGRVLGTAVLLPATRPSPTSAAT